jgi:RNA polymerase sigma-70 factor (ECF subfamily)
MKTKYLWDEFSKELLRFIASKTGDSDLAKDLLQEVFIKVHLKIPQLDNRQQIRSWLYTVSANTVTDYFRNKISTTSLPEIKEEEETESTHSAENCLMPLINELPEKYQQALLLSEIYNMKQKNVAEILGVSLSGAKSRIQRGRRLLQEGYIKCCSYSINKHGKLVGETKTKMECKVCN